MNLKKLTLLAIIGIIYIFNFRTIGTLIPSIFRNPQVVKIAGILSLLATLTLVFFFISFYRDYVQSEPDYKKHPYWPLLGLLWDF